MSIRDVPIETPLGRDVGTMVRSGQATVKSRALAAGYLSQAVYFAAAVVNDASESTRDRLLACGLLIKLSGCEKIEVIGSGLELPPLRILTGVLQIPEPVSAEEWSKAAQRHQQELAAGGTP